MYVQHTFLHFGLNLFRIIVIPKSTHWNRMEENLNVLDFELTESDMATLRTLDLGRPMDGWPSDALTY